MTRDELIRRLRRLARERGATFEVIAARGKGGHWTVQYGSVRVPQAKGGDLAPGTLQAVLRAYGLRRGDLE